MGFCLLRLVDPHSGSDNDLLSPNNYKLPFLFLVFLNNLYGVFIDELNLTTSIIYRIFFIYFKKSVNNNAY